MLIRAEGLGKKFIGNWIFRNLTTLIEPGTSTSITGNNGSGKSTLIKLLSAGILASEGNINYSVNGKPIPSEEIYKYISFSAPYIDLIEEFTLRELVIFHIRFKELENRMSVQEFISRISLEKFADREIKIFSSGMKQRLKLGLSLFSSAPLILLDEPTTNLDEVGKNWYLNVIYQIRGKKTIVVSSNIAEEYSFCTNNITMGNYKNFEKIP
jgi:ABC-type multidrug transport system ATPase subunit